jgi:Ca2+-binding RTX toxin-like protein
VVDSVTVTPAAAGTCTLPPATPAPPASQLVTCNIGAIPGNGVVTVTIVATPVDPAANVTNTATATQVGNPNNVTTATTPAPITVNGQSLRCFGLAPTIFGTNGPDTIDGTPGNDVIVGLGGNDTIDGEGGNDTICGGNGNDHIYGGSGDDRISGGRGSDLLDGGAGTNVLRGGRDTVGFGPFNRASADNGWRHRHGDVDILICQRGIDDCRGGFDGDRGRDRGRFDGDHGDRTRIIWIPRRGGGFGGGGGNFGPGPFSAHKGAPAQPVAPAAKPAAKPVPKPAVAGTEHAAPKH